MGALVICAEAVHTSMEMLQINFLVILEGKKRKNNNNKSLIATFF